MGVNDFSFANLANLNALDDLHQSYLKDPQSVDASWRHFFEGMQFAQSAMPTISKPAALSPDLRVHLMIEAYRKFGHLCAKINPIATSVLEEPKEIQLQTLGFEQEELEVIFPTCGFLKETTAPLKNIITALKQTYCDKVGFECVGLDSSELESWIQQQIEPNFPLHLENTESIEILKSLNRAEFFETFLHTKFVGQKRFSLEGCETLIPMLSTMIHQGAEQNVQEVVIGMAHRGRLNVLANILNKSYGLIFHEFEDHYLPSDFEGTGDVKYHKGFVSSLSSPSGKKINVTLVANPSHLETVDPVLEGIARAKQQLHGQVLPFLIHGDASIAGQGVVYETLQLSRLNGYNTCGTIHVVVNNQIGFTTLPKDTRSTRYCSEVARAFGCPVFHVNAEDPESCIRIANLSVEIRQKFQCDVIIDLNCYRKYGHNESDEPTFTQPLEYSLIRAKKTIREILKEKLISAKTLSIEEAEKLETSFKEELQKELEGIKAKNLISSEPPVVKKGESLSTCQTAVENQTLIKLAEIFCSLPENITLHPKIRRLLQERLSMMHADSNKPSIDWGMAEHLAYATLLTEKIHVRISGQDVRRGTFSHRHAIFTDQVTGKRYFPLSHLDPAQAPFDIFNSPLSEYAVLGFDFGYSVAYPNSLVIWEAQFGDFVNGAQIIIDQYISSSEQKWNLSSNITLQLPHGNEGQGPEHTSGRMERFLQQCAQDNMRICNCSTPAQLFHLLRAQAHLKNKKPLVIFTPKAILRHPECISSLNDFSKNHFQEVIAEEIDQPKRVFFCSGKVYYDLVQERKLRNANDVALIRVEQLYPFPKVEIEKVLKKYKDASISWVQEEHSNMGAWEYIHPQLNSLLNVEEQVKYCGRIRSASPAAGSHALHKKQFEEFMNHAFDEGKR